MIDNKNTDNIYISHGFNLNKNKRTNEIYVMLRQDIRNRMIARIIINEDKTITINIADDYKDVYSQEDIGDIVIEKSIK